MCRGIVCQRVEGCPETFLGSLAEGGYTGTAAPVGMHGSDSLRGMVEGMAGGQGSLPWAQKGSMIILLD